MKLLTLLVLLLTFGLVGVQVPSMGQDQQRDPFVLENKQKHAQNPEGLSFTVRFKDNQSQFRQGEVIRLELSFASSKPKTFILDAATYDRSGRLMIDNFILDRHDGFVDPLNDYFNSRVFVFIGGGLRSTPVLTDKPKTLNAELNEWVRFDKPGHYRLYVVSNRVRGALKPDDTFGHRGPGVVSNIVEFDVLPATEKWATQKLNEATKLLSNDVSDGRVSDADRRAACRTLRFLGTTAAASEMIRRFRGNDGCDFEYMFGLIGTPHRNFVLREMDRALSLPEQPIPSSFLRTLVLLEFTTNSTAVPPYPEGNSEQAKQWQAQVSQRRQAYEQVFLSYLRQLAAAIPHKQEKARAVSLQTLLENYSSAKMRDSDHFRNLLATLPEVFSLLSRDAQTRLLTYQWKPFASEAMLPVLRGILRQPDDNNNRYEQREQRSIALRRLYELSPDEGRELIIEDISRPKPRMNSHVLRLLPNESLPEVDDLLATNLEKTRQQNSESDVDAISDLIERYATATVLPRVRRFYEDPGVGRWACRPQASLLAYILRTDPTTGGELLSKALAARGKGLSRCYTMTLKDVAQLRMSAEVEEAAIVSLKDEDPEVVSQAASVLGEFGSAQSEKHLWRRLEDWREELKVRAEDLSEKHPGIPASESDHLSGQALIEHALYTALINGRAWVAGPEKLSGIRDLCLTQNCRKEIDRIITNWSHRVFVALNPVDGEPYSISVAHYNLKSLETLKQKLLQFPRGTVFAYVIMTNGEDAKAKEVFQQLKNYLEDHGMKLEWEGSQSEP